MVIWLTIHERGQSNPVRVQYYYGKDPLSDYPSNFTIEDAIRTELAKPNVRFVDVRNPEHPPLWTERHHKNGAITRIKPPSHHALRTGRKANTNRKIGRPKDPRFQDEIPRK